MAKKQITLKLRRIGCCSLATFGCFWGMVTYGLFFGAFLSPFIGANLNNVLRLRDQTFFSLALFWVLVVVFAALFAGIAGFIQFAITGALFNIVSRFSGGIVFHYEYEVDDHPHQDPIQRAKKETLEGVRRALEGD